MRPKLLSLLAVSALALAGCGTVEQTPSHPSKTVVPSSSPSPKTVKASEDASPSFSKAENNFVIFAETRAENLGITDLPSTKKIVQQFNQFCDADKQIKISKIEDLNTNMELAAESTFCDMRD